MALGVRLGDQGEAAARPFARQHEGEAHDAFYAGAGEHRGLDADLAGEAGMRAATGTGVLALRVLAHDDPVEVVRRDVPKRARDAGQKPRGADVGVLVETLADGEPQSPQRDVVGHRDVADRDEVDGVEAGQPGEGVGRHHGAGRAVEVRAPGKALEFELEVRRRGRERLEHGEAGLGHLAADAIAGNYRDAVRRHRSPPSSPNSSSGSIGSGRAVLKPPGSIRTCFRRV